MPTFDTVCAILRVRLLNIEMPEMDGCQVLAALAAEPRLRDLPMVRPACIRSVIS